MAVKTSSKRPASESATSSKSSSSQEKAKKKFKSNVPLGSSSPSSKTAPLRQRRHADIVEEAKGLWNRLRIKSNTPQQKRQLLDQIIPLIEGKACQIALQHDASRVVQAAIQFGTPSERSAILKELLEDGSTFMELCKSQYAHFLVLKVIKYCHKEDGESILKAFKGHMSKLAIHAVGARVVEALFTTFTAKQISPLKQEFYGPHFALFAREWSEQDELPTLKSNLERLPDKKDKTLAAVASLVNKGATKSLYGMVFFQEILFEYLSAIEPHEVRAFAATAEIVHLFSSRPGTQAAALIVSYGSAKDRKRLLKSLKGYARSALLHHDAYLAILRLVQLTDDTVSVQKNLLNELTTTPPQAEGDQDSPLLELALSQPASKLFRMLLAPASWKKLFDPYEHSVLFPNPMVKEGGQQVPTSKKEDSVRRNELLQHLQEPLEALCQKHTSQLLKSKSGSFVLRDTYASFRSPGVVTAIVEACQKDPSLLEDFYGHLAVKNIILSDAEDDEAIFTSAFMEKFQDLDQVCATNRGAFVVEALCKVPKAEKNVKKVLKKKHIEKSANGEGATAGFKALLSALDS